MTKENKKRIIDAVNEVYWVTDKGFEKVYSKDVTLVVPSSIVGVYETTIKITRSVNKGDLTYKLYTKHDTNPLLTVFGCWPQEFVTDIFIRSMEHFYDDYD